MRRNLLWLAMPALALALLAGLALVSPSARAQFPAPDAALGTRAGRAAAGPGTGAPQPSTARRLPAPSGNTTLLPAPPLAPANCVITGAITLTDAGHTTEINGLADPSTCANAACPGPYTPGGTFNYDVYTFTNNLNTPQCISITITDFGCTGGLISAVYQNSFDPLNVCTNYLGDSSALGIFGTGSYSVTVAASSTFIIDIESYTTNVTCASYTLAVLGDVSGPGCATGGTATPTPTAIPGTATATPTRTRTATATAEVSTSTPTWTSTAIGGTSTPTATRTATATAGASTSTPTWTSTAIGGAGTPTATRTVTPTLTVCPIQFTDVGPSDPFYSYIRCLVCRGILSGYTTTPPCAAGQTPCYNGGANVTRGQVAKIVANAAGFNDVIPSTQQTFADVPNSNPFWVFIERAAAHNVISGYSSSPPCPVGQVPCFLPFNDVTRGQMAKIDAQAAGFNDVIPSTQQTFSDVPSSNPFWIFVERAVLHGVISGYSTSPPCVPGGVPCFLWANNLTRNQAAKIVAVSFYPNCQTPAHQGTKAEVEGTR